jgi:hypothetical protein
MWNLKAVPWVLFLLIGFFKSMLKDAPNTSISEACWWIALPSSERLMCPPAVHRCVGGWELRHAVRNDARQLHHLLAQCVIFLNLALNAIAVSL